MFYVQDITNYPTQNKVMNLADGSQITITMAFVPMQKSWVIRYLEYGDFIVRNVKMVKNPNILRQFKNIIPFGIAIDSTQDRDPMFVEDFSTQTFSMFILSREEVQAYEDFLSGLQV